MSGRIVAREGCVVADVVASLRAAGAEDDMVTLLIEPQVAAIDRAMLIAAVGALATHLAPKGRIAAIDIAPGAAAGDVAAAVAFLESALSTTGQVLRVARES